MELVSRVSGEKWDVRLTKNSLNDSAKWVVVGLSSVNNWWSHVSPDVKPLKLLNSLHHLDGLPSLRFPTDFE